MSEGHRNNAGKPKIHFVLEAKEALEGASRVLEYGAENYARGNWKKGLNVTQTIDSLARHLMAYLNGEDNDEESGLPHVDHVLTNALFLATHARNPQLDDRL